MPARRSRALACRSGSPRQVRQPWAAAGSLRPSRPVQPGRGIKSRRDRPASPWIAAAANAEGEPAIPPDPGIPAGSVAGTGCPIGLQLGSESGEGAGKALLGSSRAVPGFRSPDAGTAGIPCCPE